MRPSNAVEWTWVAQVLCSAAGRTLPTSHVVVTLVGGLGNVRTATAAGPAGRRVARLLFRWADIEPYAHLPLDEFREALQGLCTVGGVLRARTRWEQHEAAA